MARLLQISQDVDHLLFLRKDKCPRCDGLWWCRKQPGRGCPVHSIYKAPPSRGRNTESLIIEYEVFGLPPGHRAIIALAPDGWYIQHSNDGIPGERVGAYEAATAALMALREALAEE